MRRTSHGVYAGEMFGGMSPRLRQHCRDVYRREGAWNVQGLVTNLMKGAWMMENYEGWRSRREIGTEICRRERAMVRGHTLSNDQCWDYKKKGGCRAGDTCKWFHVGMPEKVEY